MLCFNYISNKIEFLGSKRSNSGNSSRGGSGMSTLSEHRASPALSRGDHGMNSAGINKPIHVNSNANISEFQVFIFSYLLVNLYLKPAVLKNDINRIATV